jgi:hypothetical protein
MLSENLRLHEALAKLHSKETRVQAALAATQANYYASRHQWSDAVAAFERLVAADPTKPAAWLRTPGLLRLATALVHQNRPDIAATLLQGGAKRRAEDGLPPITKEEGGGRKEESKTSSSIVPRSSMGGDLFFPLLAEVKKRLATDDRDVGLLELRAELAGQESDIAGQAAFYTSAIKILDERMKDEGERMKEETKTEGGRVKQETRGSDSSFILHPCASGRFIAAAATPTLPYKNGHKLLTIMPMSSPRTRPTPSCFPIGLVPKRHSEIGMAPRPTGREPRLGVERGRNCLPSSHGDSLPLARFPWRKVSTKKLEYFTNGRSLKVIQLPRNWLNCSWIRMRYGQLSSRRR